MSPEGWKTVTRDDKKRVMRRRGKRTLTTVGHHAISTAIDDGMVLDSIIQKCIMDLKQTDLYQTLMLWLQGRSTSRRTLVCYGIGNFSHSSSAHYSASLWQIACALSLMDESKADKKVNRFYYDPCASPFEKRFLEERSVQVLTTNDRGKLAFAADDDSVTLFFMPHCPRALYEHVIWANWHSLSRTIIVGNSIANLMNALSTTKERYACLNALVPWIQETKLEASKKDLKQAPGNFVGAFNDTYCMRFSLGADGLNDSWPDRPELNARTGEDNELL